jgi:hypothetical protein
MGNILRPLKPQQQEKPVDPHGLTLATAAAIADLTRDLRSFESTSMVTHTGFHFCLHACMFIVSEII